jgi:hypothetical protein
MEDDQSTDTDVDNYQWPAWESIVQACQRLPKMVNMAIPREHRDQREIWLST